MNSIPRLIGFLLALDVLLTKADSVPNENKDYSRYKQYPPYCSIPEEMQRRAVPPLHFENNEHNSEIIPQIVHVTSLIRHGARTPWAGAPAYKCWNGYWENPETGVWDCDLKTYISPPSTGKENVVTDNGGILEEEPDVLFEKRYDALIYSKENTTGLLTSGNELNGTCQLGQLIMRGYDQEIQNGLHLRQAYIYDGNNTLEHHAAAVPSMRLWDVTTKKSSDTGSSGAVIIGDLSKKPYQEPNLRYRSDDEQRTLMSGQILLRGLFGPEILAADDKETQIIRLHTGDYMRDVLVINQNICQRLTDLEHEAYNSEEYKRWNETSVEVQVIRKFAESKMDLNEIPGGILDCLMTTMCTDRPLPELIDDYDGSLGPTSWNIEGSEGIAIVSEKDFTNIFERLVNYAVKQSTFAYKFNDAAWAKLGMGPLWKEIMANILPIVDSGGVYSFARETPPKFAVFSGHDTTLLPLLATLGQDVWSGFEWAPYASMILIEVYQMLNSDKSIEYSSGYAFRLIYNGNVLTSLMDGCNSELCDSQVLVQHVMQFAKFEERDCVSKHPSAEESENPNQAYEEGVMSETERLNEAPGEDPRQKWLLMGVSLLSAVLGSILTFVAMRRHQQSAYDLASSSALRELSMVETDNETEYKSNFDNGSYNGGGIDTAVSSRYAKEDDLDEDKII